MTRSFVVLVCVFAFASSARADVLLSQPTFWTGNGTSTGSAWSIEYSGADAYGFRTFDDFTLAADANIAAVTWYAMTYDFVGTGNNPVGLNGVQSYEVAFYANNGNVPGAQLQAETTGVANVTATQVGTGVFGGSAVNLYEFVYTLSSPFQALAGTTYWFSPLVNTADYAPEVIGWVRGTNGNDVAFQIGLGGAAGAGAGFISDRAFELTGAIVPEPALVTLLSTALMAVGARRLRRTSRS